MDSLPSTNQYLKEHSDLQDGTVVVVSEQTCGRGRFSSVWLDHPGILKFSVLLKNMKDPTSVTLLAALAVASAIEEFVPLQADIKWTNDILINNSKVCGILCEGVLKRDGFSVICGIGINVNTPKDFFETNGLLYADSLFSLSGKEISQQDLLYAILNRLEPLLEQGFLSIREEYKSRCITIGSQIKVFYHDKEVVAKALDVDEQGWLVCENKNGRFTVNSGEVRVRGLMGYT